MVNPEKIEITDTDYKDVIDGVGRVIRPKSFSPLALLWAMSLYIFVTMVILGLSPPLKKVHDFVFSLSANLANIPLGKVFHLDDRDLGGADQNETFEVSGKTIDVLIWDYSAEDGDQIALFVNDSLVVTPFVLTHKPVAFSIPTGILKVVGVGEGGLYGVTFAIHIPEIKTTLAKRVTEGNSATYKFGIGER
jgi:hypothetical protein